MMGWSACKCSLISIGHQSCRASRAGCHDQTDLCLKQISCGLLQVDETGLLNLLAVLKLPVQISKGALPRLFLNLSFCVDTSAALLRIMLSLLRDAFANGEDSAAPDAGREADAMDEEGGGVRRLEDALLQVRFLSC